MTFSQAFWWPASSKQNHKRTFSSGFPGSPGTENQQGILLITGVSEKPVFPKSSHQGNQIRLKLKYTKSDFHLF